MIEEAWKYLLSLAAGNDFLQGGFVLGVIGTLGVWARNVPKKAIALLKRRFLVECDVQQHDDAFEAIVEWLAKHPYGRRTRRFSASVKNGQIELSPAPGYHLVWYHKRPILVNRGREKQTKGDNAFMGFYEQFTLQTLGRGRDVLESLIREAVKERLERLKKGTQIYVLSSYGWEVIGSPTRRPLNSVVLPGSKVTNLATDAARFLAAKDTYASLGVPYRRGYLLYGPPGTGKSSLVLALAGHLGLDVAVISLSGKTATDSNLSNRLSLAPDKAILLLEDVDCLFGSNREKKDAEGVTLSGLLNVLDGVIAPEGRIICMTTNYLEHLDPALIRPGRADVHVNFSLADKEQAYLMYLRFFPRDLQGAEQFASTHGDGTKVAAELQRDLMIRRFSAIN